MTTKQTAAQAYEERQNDVGALLDTLAQQMRMHADYAKADGMDWAKVGDLTEVRRQLIQTLAFLAQQDETFIENHLQEMREGRKA